MKLAFTIIVPCMAALVAKAQGIGTCSDSKVRQRIEPFCRSLEANPRSSLAHFNIAETFFRDQDLMAATNEFREALNGDLERKWIAAKAHIELGKIFSITGQHDRAVNEYRQALATGDDTAGVLEEAAMLLKDAGSNAPVRFPIPSPLNRAEPVVKVPAAGYTSEARIAELEGVVLVEATIGVDGYARDLAVHRPLGLGLDEQAVDAVRSWLFEPVEADAEAAPPVRRIIRVDFHLESKASRWHLIGVAFDAPAGSARPAFVKAIYPRGAGIVRRADIIERAQVLGGIGRPATATLSFVINEQGRPTEIRVEWDSDPMWGSQAEALVDNWRFKPGMMGGKPIAVACSVDLLWGPRRLSADVADRFSSVSRARR